MALDNFTEIFTSIEMIILLASGFCFFCLLRNNVRRKENKMNLAARSFIINQIEELRRPLQGLIGVQDLYSNNQSPASINDYFAITNYCTRHLIRQLDRLQFFVQFDDEIRLSVPSTFSLRSCVKNAISQVQTAEFAGAIKLNTHISPKIGDTIIGYEKALRLILIELLDNSLKYGGNGLISITFTIPPEAPNSIQIGISDSGQGLPMSEVKVFSPTSSKPNNTWIWPNKKNGIGLLTVNRIINKIGAKATVSTELGRGTTYTILLPQTAFRPSQSAPQEIQLESPTKKRALVVDDDPITRHVIANMLNKLSINVDQATDGKNAITQFQEQKYDVVFMDLDMPIMNGFDAGKNIIKNQDPNKKTTLIALSVFCRRSDIERCYKIGFSDFISKPAELDTIRASLRRHRIIEGDTLSPNPKKMEFHKPKNNTAYNHINFNLLLNAMDKDLPLCLEVLKQMKNSLHLSFESLESAIHSNAHKEIFTILHKIEGEFTLIHCHRGLKLAKNMSRMAPHANLAEMVSSCTELRLLIEDVLIEIELLTTPHRSAQ